MQRPMRLAESPVHDFPQLRQEEIAARQPFRQSRTSLGVAGHWVHLLAVLSPLVIGELVKDPEKRWRAIRLASVGTALATEALWTHRLLRRHEEQEHREQQR